MSRRSDERDLEKVSAAYERGVRKLAEAEAELERAEAEHNAELERAAADDLCAGRDLSTANGKADRALVEARARADAAAAGVRGLKAGAEELAARVAAAQREDAEKAHDAAVVAEADAVRLLAERREDTIRTRQRLGEAKATVHKPARLWEPAAQARVRAAEDELVEQVASGNVDVALLPANLRDRVPAARERLNRERERDNTRFREAVERGDVPDTRAIDVGPGMAPGETFERLPRV